MTFERPNIENNLEFLDNLPYSFEEIEDSEEMRVYKAKELGLSEDASWDEIAEKEDEVVTAKIAVAVGLPETATQDEVITREKELGVDMIGHLILLGLGYDATPEQITEAKRQKELRKEAMYKVVAEEMRFNRAKKIVPPKQIPG